MKVKTLTLLTIAVIVLPIVAAFFIPAVAHAQLPLPPGVKREDVVIFDVQISKVRNPDNFNPWVIGQQASVIGVSQLCLDALWYTDYVHGKDWPIVAAEYPPKYEDDYSKVIVKIRKGIYWSDGVEMTAEDWVFGIEYALKNENSPQHAFANAWIKRAYVIDRYTFAIELKRPSPYFHYYFVVLGPGIYNWVMPKHYFEKKGLSIEEIHADKFNPPVCIGPYVLEAYDPAGTWFLWKRRDDWYRSSIKWVLDLAIAQGTTKPTWPWQPDPKISQPVWPGPKYVMYRVFTSEEGKVIAMSRGELDWIFDATPEAWKAIKARVGDKAIAWYEHWPWFWGYDTTNRGIYFNVLKYPYNITAVRWALALATNMTRVLIEGYEGTQRAVVVPIAAMEPAARYWNDIIVPIVSKWTLRDVLGEVADKCVPEYADMPIWDPEVGFRVYEWGRSQGLLTKELPPEEITRIWGPGWWKYAPEVAEKILTCLGFKKEGGKWYLPDGTPWKIKMNIPAGFELDAVRLGLAVAEEWRRFGIDVETIPLDAAVFWTDQMNYKKYTVGAYWGTGASDPQAPLIRLDSWRCVYVKPVGEYSPNPNGYCNKEFDKYFLEAMSHPPGSKETMEAAKKALLIFIKDMPVIWMGNCKKLLPILTEYWKGWPSAYNYYWGPKLWGTQSAKIVLMALTPVKSTMDVTFEEYLKEVLATATPSPSPTTSPSPTPSPTPTVTVTGPGVTVTVTKTVEKTVTAGAATVTKTVEKTVTTATTVKETTTITTTEWSITTAIGIVLLIIGIAIGYAIKRR